MQQSVSTIINPPLNKQKKNYLKNAENKTLDLDKYPNKSITQSCDYERFENLEGPTDYTWKYTDLKGHQHRWINRKGNWGLTNSKIKYSTIYYFDGESSYISELVCSRCSQTLNPGRLQPKATWEYQFRNLQYQIKISDYDLIYKKKVTAGQVYNVYSKWLKEPMEMLVTSTVTEIPGGEHAVHLISTGFPIK